MEEGKVLTFGGWQVGVWRCTRDTSSSSDRSVWPLPLSLLQNPYIHTQTKKNSHKRSTGAGPWRGRLTFLTFKSLFVVIEYCFAEHISLQLQIWHLKKRQMCDNVSEVGVAFFLFFWAKHKKKIHIQAGPCLLTVQTESHKFVSKNK